VVFYPREPVKVYNSLLAIVIDRRDEKVVNPCRAGKILHKAAKDEEEPLLAALRETAFSSQLSF
jgi:hypothetical protein